MSSMAASRKPIYFRKFASHEAAEAAELDYWLSLTPEERVEAVGSCLVDQLRLQGKTDGSPPRLRRVCRVLKRQ